MKWNLKKCKKNHKETALWKINGKQIAVLELISYCVQESKTEEFEGYKSQNVYDFEKDNLSRFTVWKLKTFSVTQILREIKVGESRVSHFKALNFDFYQFCTFWSEKFTKITKLSPKNCKNCSFRTSSFSQIDVKSEWQKYSEISTLWIEVTASIWNQLSFNLSDINSVAHLRKTSHLVL